MLRLRPYKRSDAKYIVRWVTEEKMFYQWSAGRMGAFPLTADRLNAYYDSYGEVPDFWTMTAFDEEGIPRGQFIMRYPGQDKSILRLGFIVVDNTLRGKGYGKEMLQLAAAYAFHFLGAEKLSLGVFTNNPAAIHCYEAAGFAKIPDKKAKIYELMGEEWECVDMELSSLIVEI